MRSDDLAEVRRTLWKAADELRANSTLTPADYRGPVLGLIFLAYAEHRFDAVRQDLEAHATPRSPVTPDDYRARSVLYVPEQARLSTLVDLPEGDDLGAAVDAAMKAVEAANPELRDVLPRGYQRLERTTLTELLRLFSPLPRKLTGDAFGLIYEDFLSNFAMAEGRLGGEFFTPYSIVRLIVEIIEPFHGKVFDPACGSGGMFVQCAKFVERHSGSATRELSIYGQEQKEVTVPLAKMNLALHGLSGDIRLGNSYYDDLHDSVDRFDFIMANPPFNVDGVRKDRLAWQAEFDTGRPWRRAGAHEQQPYSPSTGHQSPVAAPGPRTGPVGGIVPASDIREPIRRLASRDRRLATFHNICAEHARVAQAHAVCSTWHSRISTESPRSNVTAILLAAGLQPLSSDRRPGRRSWVAQRSA